jgi:putative two-component system response regulator
MFGLLNGGKWSENMSQISGLAEDGELEDVEELDESSDTNQIANTFADKKSALKSINKRSVVTAKVFQNSAFPVLIINKNFDILYSNKACSVFFDHYFTIRSSPFFDIFGRYFSIDSVRGIRETILKGKNGYSWQGIARFVSRERPTTTTRVYLFPAGIDVVEPETFTLLFDDISEENRRFLRSFFLSLLEASKLKDNDTGKHITRVNYYSDALARVLYNNPNYEMVDAEFIDNIGFLAAMHDVGKIGTPDDILNKEGPLSDFEWTIMQEHTKNGAFLLEAYPNPIAKAIALSHHEKWNGKGYPFQMEGKMIPLAARIVSIADVYDALRMRRSYKPGFSHQVTMEKMLEVRGTQFDPNLFDIFVDISERFNEIYEKNKDME